MDFMGSSFFDVDVVYVHKKVDYPLDKIYELSLTRVQPNSNIDDQVLDSPRTSARADWDTSHDIYKDGAQGVFPFSGRNVFQTRF